MSLDRLMRARKRLLWFTAGGGIASLLLGISAILASPIIELRCPDPIPGMWSAVAYISFLVALLSLIPFPPGFYLSDGAMLRMLLTSVEGTRYLLASYGAGMQLRKGVDPYNMNERWAEIANLKGLKHQAEYTKAWRAYATNADSSVSDVLPEKCLSQAAWISRETREHLISEAAYFCAWSRKDAVKARVWGDRLNKTTILPYLVQIRLETAMHFATGNPQAALKSCEKGLRYIQNMPQGSRGRQLETTWLEWKKEIESAAESKRANHL